MPGPSRASSASPFIYRSMVGNLVPPLQLPEHPWSLSCALLSQKSDLGASPSPPGSLHRLVLNSKAKANVAWLLWSSEHRGSGPSSSALGSKPAANPHQTRIKPASWMCVCVCVCACVMGWEQGLHWAPAPSPALVRVLIISLPYKLALG